MIEVDTFDPMRGGNVLYKALAHPLAAERMAALADWLHAHRPFAVVDPRGGAEALWMLYPDLPRPADVLVQDVQQVGQQRLGRTTRPLDALASSEGATIRGVLVMAFDADRLLDQFRWLLPPDAPVTTLDVVRIDPALLSEPRRYLDPLNFATNFVFFRDQDGLATRLVTANYWSGYGSPKVSFWCRLFDADGRALATWTEPTTPGVSGIVLDSREVRRRFGLPPFAGQIFMQVIGARGHDTVKYALDTFATDGGPSLSCTHDANAWPAAHYAGLPAPAPGERVILWVQNSHAAPMPERAIALRPMGGERAVPLEQKIPGFGSVALDVADLLPGLRWPAQIEVHAGRHMVRPRYEVVAAGRTRIAHVNVERDRLSPDPQIRMLGDRLGRGFLLPFPILPAGRFESIALPTPMSLSQDRLPLRVELFDREGDMIASKFLGCLPRGHAHAVMVDELAPPGRLAEGGHGELRYDFTEGGEADGWLHGLFRYRDRESGHAAETSFGGHMFNTIMVFKDEPQSYAGPPPGLSTRLFLRLGHEGFTSFAHLIYPASSAWRPRSDTTMILHDGDGQRLAEQKFTIACSGSATVRPTEVFDADLLHRAGERGYVIIRDSTCRLFGYHGLEDGRGGFAFDHMFGF
jgi:hypothetical protein